MFRPVELRLRGFGVPHIPKSLIAVVFNSSLWVFVTDQHKYGTDLTYLQRVPCHDHPRFSRGHHEGLWKYTSDWGEKYLDNPLDSELNSDLC